MSGRLDDFAVGNAVVPPIYHLSPYLTNRNGNAALKKEDAYA